MQDAFKKVSGSWDDPAAADSRQTYSYAWWDGAMQSGISNDHDDDTGTAAWTTSYSFDSSGHITSAAIADQRPRTVTYAVDAAGMVTSRDEELNATGDDAGPRQLRYHFAGIQIGEAGNNGTDNLEFMASTADRLKPAPTTPGLFRNGATGGTPFADFEQAYEAINGVFNAGTAQSYTVTGGESLAAIAQATWGDASLWYLIADANGLSGAESLAAGRTLILPNKVRANRNSADTWRPYDPNDAMGDTSPTDAKPKKNKCGTIGMILMVAIAVAVTAVLTGPLSTMMSHLFAGPAATQAAALTATAAAAAPGAAAATVAAGAIAGVAGSLASQAFGVLTGIQDKFSFKDIALAGISGAVSGGLTALGNAAKFGQVGGLLGTLGNAMQPGFVGGAVRGVLGSALGQGIGVATGLQKDFSFAGIAAAGVGGSLSSGLGLRGPAGNMVSGMAGGLANAAARSLLTGSDFGDTLKAALPDIIGSTIGNMLADLAATKPSPRSAAASALAAAGAGAGAAGAAMAAAGGSGATAAQGHYDHLLLGDSDPSLFPSALSPERLRANALRSHDGWMDARWEELVEEAVSGVYSAQAAEERARMIELGIAEVDYATPIPSSESAPTVPDYNKIKGGKANGLDRVGYLKHWVLEGAAADVPGAFHSRFFGQEADNVSSETYKAYWNDFAVEFDRQARLTRRFADVEMLLPYMRQWAEADPVITPLLTRAEAYVNETNKRADDAVNELFEGVAQATWEVGKTTGAVGAADTAYRVVVLGEKLTWQHALDALPLVNKLGKLGGKTLNFLDDAKAAESEALSPFTQRYLTESGGRWGGTATRQQNYAISQELKSRGYTVKEGGGIGPEEYIAGAGPGTKGSTFVDITSTAPSGRTVRIQTITTRTLPDGRVVPTASEAAAAARIRAAFPNDKLLLVPKR